MPFKKIFVNRGKQINQNFKLTVFLCYRCINPLEIIPWAEPCLMATRQSMMTRQRSSCRYVRRSLIASNPGACLCNAIHPLDLVRMMMMIQNWCKTVLLGSCGCKCVLNINFDAMRISMGYCTYLFRIHNYRWCLLFGVITTNVYVDFWY